MIIPIRTVRGKEYQIEIDSNKTIGDLKQKFSEESDNYPVDKLKFIFQARILKNDVIVSTLKIPEHSYVIVHYISDDRPIVPKSKKPSQQTDLVNVIPEEPKVPPQPQPDQPGNQANKANLIDDLASMGFDKKLCEKALNLADNNVEMAVTLLLNGTVKAEDENKGDEDNKKGDENQKVDGGNNEQPLPDLQGQFDGELQEYYNQLNNEEKAAIARLLKYGNPNEVIQTYFACQKDEELTKSCFI